MTTHSTVLAESKAFMAAMDQLDAIQTDLFRVQDEHWPMLSASALRLREGFPEPGENWRLVGINARVLRGALEEVSAKLACVETTKNSQEFAEILRSLAGKYWHKAQSLIEEADSKTTCGREGCRYPHLKGAWPTKEAVMRSANVRRWHMQIVHCTGGCECWHVVNPS